MLKAIPRDYFDQPRGTLKLLWEDEWRALGITQVGTAKPNQRQKETDHNDRAWAGNITKCMSQNHISYYSSTPILGN